MKVALVAINAKYIHKNLAVRYLYQTCPNQEECSIFEFTTKDAITKIGDAILVYKPQVVGISTYIWNTEQVKALASYLKSIQPSLHIFLGGPEVSFDANYYLTNYAIDAVSCGEGEFTVWEYINCLENGITCFDIPGIYTKNHTPTIKYPTVSLAELEKYEMPYFMSMDESSMENRYLYVETSRGCPYQCSYCLSSVQGGVRLFSSEYVFKVLDLIFKSKARQIKFLDRTFNVDKTRALAIAQYIDEHATELQSFQFEIMAEHLSEELITYLEHKENGPKFRFEIGIQTTNERSLKEIHRVQDFKKLSEVVKRISKSSLCELHVDLIAGLPYEDYLSFQASFNDVFYLFPDELQLGFLKLLRGTSLKENANSYKMEYQAQAPYEITSTAWVSSGEMDKIRDVAYAVEHLYNKNRMRRTLLYCIKSLSIEPFELFSYLGNILRANKPKNYYELFTAVWELLENRFKDEAILGLLNEEYYALSKQRVKRLVNFNLDNQKELICFLNEAGIGSVNDLINYGTFAQGYESILFVLYNKNQTYPKRYRIKQNVIIEIKE